jgi:hypothetical protein
MFENGLTSLRTFPERDVIQERRRASWAIDDSVYHEANCKTKLVNPGPH